MKSCKLLAVALAFLMVGQTGAVESQDDFKRAAAVMRKIAPSKFTEIPDKMCYGDNLFVQYGKLKDYDKNAIKAIASMSESEVKEDSEKLNIWNSVQKLSFRFSFHLEALQKTEEKTKIELKENKEKQRKLNDDPQQLSTLMDQEKKLNRLLPTISTQIEQGTIKPLKSLYGSKGAVSISPSVVEGKKQDQAQVKNEESKDDSNQNEFQKLLENLKPIVVRQNIATGGLDGNIKEFQSVLKNDTDRKRTGEANALIQALEDKKTAISNDAHKRDFQKNHEIDAIQRNIDELYFNYKIAKPE